MKTTKISIKNLYGIKEMELDGRPVELTGTNGAGKSSVLDAIRYALTNQSSRDFIIRQGEKEGEILIETDTGLRINRKKRTDKADYKSVKENGKDISAPESFLSTIFTPLQLDPVAFTLMSKQEQNRVILDLIEFPWDLTWIKEQFGELPNVNYDQNILQVLNDIQAENGDYFQRRQDINRDIRNKRAFIYDIAKDIPASYDAEKWESFPLGDKYRELERIRENNSIIGRAKAFKEAYDNKKRGLEAERDMKLVAVTKEVEAEKTSLLGQIERLKAELIAAEDKVKGLSATLTNKKAVVEAEHREALAKLGQDMDLAEKYSGATPEDTSALAAEIEEAEAMKAHLNEFRRMKGLQSEMDDLIQASEELTRKIELARSLPGEILQTAKLPIDNLTIENGVPLVNGLPVSNLSDGEKLELCVDVTISKPNALQIILIDGSEKLSGENRDRLYQKCKDKGLQFIACRTTNDDELLVTKL